MRKSNHTNSPAYTRLAIIADDLTGALDAAAPFATRGLHTVVALGAGAIRAALATRPQVIAISTASREIAAGAAHDAVAAALAELPATIALFKKIDSRLKGNIQAELGAFPPGRALIAPAIPEFKRVVRNGHLEGFGVAHPIDIAAKIGLRSDGAEIPDTVTNAQMSDALRQSTASLLIGARGLAEALAKEMTSAPAAFLTTLPGPDVLFVVGSQDPITLAQVRHLRENSQINYLPAPNGSAKLPGSGRQSLLLQAVNAEETVASEVVSARLAESVVESLSHYQTILLTGGATAEAVLHRARISNLRLRGECLPGLVVAEATGHSFVTKSGGFGQVDTLLRVLSMSEGHDTK